MLMKKGDVFSFAISNGQTMFGVITNTIPSKKTCNIYNYAGTPEDYNQAMQADILIFELAISGNEFTEGRWSFINGITDSSNKSEIKDPYYVLGIPPLKLIKIDDPDFSQKITSADKGRELLSKHGMLAFAFPEGNELIAEEAYLYGKRNRNGQDLKSATSEQLKSFYQESCDHMSDFQKENFLNKWGDQINLKK